MIDGRLATHRRVDLREQRGGNLDERHAAQVGCRGEAGEISDNTTAQRDQRGLALATMRYQRVKNGPQRLPVLVLFAGRDHHPYHFNAGIVQGTGKRIKIKRRHHRIGDDGCAMLRQMPGNQVFIGEQVGTDENGIAAFRQLDLYRAHFGSEH